MQAITKSSIEGEGMNCSFICWDQVINFPPLDLKNYTSNVSCWCACNNDLIMKPSVITSFDMDIILMNSNELNGTICRSLCSYTTSPSRLN